MRSQSGRSALACALILTLVLVNRSATAACPLWENLQTARQNADDTAKAFNSVVIPPELEQRIAGLVIRKLIENPGMNMKNILDEVRGELTAAEQAQVAPYLAARLLRDNADAAFKKAEKAFTDEVNRKDAALKAAEEAFEREQHWLESEKQAIKNMPRDNTYLDRVSQITKRLRAAYEKMRADLKGFTECFPDARTFIKDKEERLQKIDLLDAEIARRRGLPATNPAVAGDSTTTTDAGDATTPQVVPGEPPPPGPLGDVYVCDGPAISPKAGKITSVTTSGFTFEKEIDGVKRSVSVKITKQPPLRVRIHQRVEIVMVAGADGPPWSFGNWECNNVVAGQLPSDNGCSNIPKYKGVGDSSTAIVRFYFGAGLNPYIRMYGGEYNSPDGTEISIVWRYRPE